MNPNPLVCELGEALDSGKILSARVIIPQTYGPDDIEKAKKWSVGRPMRAEHDHHSILGHVTCLRYEGDVLVADFDLNKENELAQRLMELIAEGRPAYTTFALPELDELYEK